MEDRTRNKGRSPVTDRPKVITYRPYFIMAAHIDRPLVSDDMKQFLLRYLTYISFDRYIHQLANYQSYSFPESSNLGVEFVVIASSSNFFIFTSCPKSTNTVKK